MASEFKNLDLEEDAPSVYRFFDEEENNLVYIALSSPTGTGPVGCGLSVVDLDD